jgi:type IV secretion system protein VirB10
MSNKNNLDPNITPTGLGSTAPIRTGVKRLNKIPILIISIVLIIILLGLGYATIKRSEKKQNQENKEGKVRNDGELLASDFISKLYQSRLTTPITLEKNKEENRTTLKTLSLTKEPRTLNEPDSDAILKKRLLEEKLALEKYKRELYKTALSAPTKVAIKSFSHTAMNRSGGINQMPNSMPPSPTDIYNQIAKAYGRTKGEGRDKQLNQNEFFFKNQKQSDNYLHAKKMKPRSPYEMKTGTLIPSVLITEINSDLPGPIKAQVSENVFDTATGNHLLIPQGSTLIGVYSSNVQYGQNRVLIAFNRILFPDGQSMNIGAMNGINQEGAAGFNDQVNNHYFKIFGSAILMGAITGGIATADTTQQDQYIESNRQKMVGALISELGQVARQMIQKNMNIAPTLEIRAGYKFNIFTTKDIILEPLEY